MLVALMHLERVLGEAEQSRLLGALTNASYRAIPCGCPAGRLSTTRCCLTGSMEQGAGVVQQEGEELLPGSAEQPDAGAHASAEAFLQGTTIAWSYLEPAERKAIRACCRAGRLQHDRMLGQLRVCLGRSVPGGSSLGPGATSPSPSQLHASLQAMVDRGARPQILRMAFENANDGGQREAQL